MADLDLNLNANGKPECSICTFELGKPREDGSVEAGILLPCNHFFGMRCLAQTLNNNPSCPLCRLQIPRDILLALRLIDREFGGQGTGDHPRPGGRTWQELDDIETQNDIRTGGIGSPPPPPSHGRPGRFVYRREGRHDVEVDGTVRRDGGEGVFGDPFRRPREAEYDDAGPPPSSPPPGARPGRWVLRQPEQSNSSRRPGDGYTRRPAQAYPSDAGPPPSAPPPGARPGRWVLQEPEINDEEVSPRSGSSSRPPAARYPSSADEIRQARLRRLQPGVDFRHTPAPARTGDDYYRERDRRPGREHEGQRHIYQTAGGTIIEESESFDFDGERPARGSSRTAGFGGPNAYYDGDVRDDEDYVSGSGGRYQYGRRGDADASDGFGRRRY